MLLVKILNIESYLDTLEYLQLPGMPNMKEIAMLLENIDHKCSSCQLARISTPNLLGVLCC